LTELAVAVTQQESEASLVKGLTQIQTKLAQLNQVLAETGKMQQLEAVDSAIKQWRSEQSIAESVLQSRFDEAIDAAALVDELRPETQQLVQAILNWQSEQELLEAIAKVSEAVQQFERGQTFDFGDLEAVLNSVNYEQLLTETGLTAKMVALTQQLIRIH
jgi:hypothetical protein